MVNITKNSTNVIILNLHENVTLTNPYYIFEFTDAYFRKNTLSLADKSTRPIAYNQFYITDGSDCTFYASGELNVYESVTDASVIDASTMNLLFTDDYKLIIVRPEDIRFDPSIQSTDYVYDPCSGTGSINQDFVFDPYWVSGQIPKLGIPADVILQDSEHRFWTDASITEVYNGSTAGDYIAEASLGTDFEWSGGYLEVVGGTGGDGGIQDASLGTDFYWEAGLLEVSLGGTGIAWVIDVSDNAPTGIWGKLWVDSSIA